MSQVKWTDEAIERALKEYDDVVKSKCVNERCVSVSVFNSAMLELKRVRAWAKDENISYQHAVQGVLNGDPAPSEENAECDVHS